MKRIFTTIAAITVIGVMATGASAASDNVKCEIAKAKAATKAFSACMKCRAKGSAAVDAGKAFDVEACLTPVNDACAAAFWDADTEYGAECSFSNNAVAQCNAASSACDNIYSSN